MSRSIRHFQQNVYLKPLRLYLSSPTAFLDATVVFGDWQSLIADTGDQMARSVMNIDYII